ncbi:endo alpha-1,4 polygalactosaminidase [Sphingobacterium bambusae]|uniref:Endo alpha-1,4 polygalactosaminidase n=1 Tax=Sphingobacterium bambusae TaxID=662858 RepID=A0ABW6BGJ0_9SPHI|nr:endo alpha-1,4 polygalactosaminidase [Sphingobacterium bambusae]WPL49573.1 endo alpha-1,4 polygalactosaminidase [Sphingobacterium bambusae]
MSVKNIILLFLLAFTACKKDSNSPDSENPEVSDYRQAMRDFVQGISAYGKQLKPGFIIIPQNGLDLVSNNGESTGSPNTAYLDAIDANGQEDLLYGYDEDNVATPAAETARLRGLLNMSQRAGNSILVIDYCWDSQKMSRSYQEHAAAGYLSFAADERSLNNIPSFPAKIQGENANNITNMAQAKNFLYLINPEKYNSKAAFIAAVRASNYDLLIMDLFLSDEAFTKDEIQQLQVKANGGKRLVICYMSIGEAEDYRYYWQSSWNSNKPTWLDQENPDWKGNFKVKYWNSTWQNIIYGQENSYTKRIIDAGFDGVYLDIIDAFEYYER